MGNEHQQRHKSDKAEAAGSSMAVQAAPEHASIASYQPLPGLSLESLNLLQGSIGNAAIGRMVKAGGVATAERPTAVSSDTQDAIDAERGNGQAMAGGVRIHSGPPVDKLARSLNANAFTQGRHVFLGAQAGHETLAHEMTHVAQGAPASGAVMREPADPNLPRPVSDPEAAPGASMGPEDGEVRYVDRLPTIGEPGIRYIVKSEKQKQADKRYNISITLYDKPITMQNLTPPEVVARLTGLWHSYHEDLSYGRTENERLKANRDEHWVVGFWSDLFGGGTTVPDVDMWNRVGRGPLAAAKQAIDATDETLRQTWEQRDTSGQRNLSPELENSPLMRQAMAFDATEQRINTAVDQLEEARSQLIECEQRLERYREGTIKGGGRAIVGIKVSIVILSAAAGGEGAAFAGQGAGLAGKAFAGAVTTGGLGASEEFFTQVGEMRIGEREDWDFDFGKIARRGLEDTVNGFVGGVIGGKFSKVLQNKVGGWIGGLSDDALRAHGLTREMMLTNGEKMFIDWVAGIGASPFTTASKTLMKSALDQKWAVNNFDDFTGLVFDDMVEGAAMDGFLKFSGSKLGNKVADATTGGEGGGGSNSGETTSSTRTAEGGAVTTTTEAAGGGSGGGGGTTTTSAPEGTGGGGGDGRASSDLGTVKTEAHPVQDVGVADTLQMPAESGKGPGDTEPMTAQDVGNLDTQTMASQEIGTRDTVEQPAARDTEPHDIGNAPTQEGPAQPEPGAAQPAEPQVSTPEGSNAPPEATPEGGGAPQGPEGPHHPIPPATGEVQPINDRVEASRIAAQAAREGAPVRWVAGGQAEANRVWQGEYGGAGDAPAAWVPADGGLVVNTNEIPAPVRSSDIVSGPLYEPGAAVPAPEGGGGGNGPMTQATGQSQAEPGGPRTMDTGASQESNVSRPEAEGIEARINGPREFASNEIVYETNDGMEAAQMSFDARARGRQIRHIDGQAEPQRLADAWAVFGGSGEPPVAWMDNFGTVIVDVSRAPDAMAAAPPQGPIANPGREVPSPDIGSEAPQQEVQSYPDFTPIPGEGRTIRQEVTSASEAGRLMHEENVAGRPVRVVSDRGLPGNVDLIYHTEYGGTQKEAPVAWMDEKGFLVVNVDKVDYGNYPTATPY